MRHLWQSIGQIAPPNLGRKRMDGLFVGGFRLLLTDGHPTITEDENEMGDLQDSEE